MLRDPTGPVQGTQRVVRGGSHVSNWRGARSANRVSALPTHRAYNDGFRVLRCDGGEFESFEEQLVPEILIQNLAVYVDYHPAAWSPLYELALLRRFVGDEEGYRDVCRRMYDAFSASWDLPSRHALLSACLFFPEGDVTPELFGIAEANAERGSAIHKRMLGLAYYRLGDDEQALPLLQQAAAERLAPNSKISSLLCLALVQLRLGQEDAAQETVQAARAVYNNSSEQHETRDRLPWGAIPSLWREVLSAIEAAGADAPLPELPPTYAEWPITGDADGPEQDP
jgi:tetratricopeptide (TPR) repeat protein